MTPPVSDNDDLNLKTLEQHIKEEQKRLEEDRWKLQKNIEAIKKRRSDGNHNQPFQDIILPKEKHTLLPNNTDNNDQVKSKCTLKENSPTFMIKNPREEEINKLIEKISKPKEQQAFSSIALNKSYPQSRSDFCQYLSPVNIREREKDQLSEKLASSECPWTKPSCRQIGKNLYSSISFNDFKPNNLERANDGAQKKRNVNEEYLYLGEKNTNVEDREEYLRAKYNHPRIVISHYKESNKEENIADLKDNKMVRIGEFSPLNPNLPGGATVLGLGEWDEKRQLLLKKYRQVSRSPSPASSEFEHSHNLRSIATQTELGDDWSSTIPLEKSPHHLCQTVKKSSQTLHGHGYEDEENRCASPQLRQSPIPKCFESMTEREVKEFIYRQELEKQIEEKNRLKEEMRKKEAEEEAKIEAKIQRDLEKMRRQYEEEKVQRLELAIRRREQEDLLRQRLAVEQQKAMQESKIMKKRPVIKSPLPNNTQNVYEKSTQSDLKQPANINAPRVPYSRSLPVQSAASALSSVHEELKQPLLQPSSNLAVEELDGFQSEDKSGSKTSSPSRKTKKPTKNASSSIPMLRSKEVDILAQKAVFDTNLNPSLQSNTFTSYSSNNVRDKLKEVDNILKQPLLPESRVLPPVSQPLIHATIPPLSASLQNHRDNFHPQSNRTNADILEDKWKVPYVEQDSEALNTKQNTRILTQLGTFRRQLQEESLRMRQRVREDSP